MDDIELKVLRCRSESELEDQLSYYMSQGWVPNGDTDVFDDMHVQAIRTNRRIDDTEEITQEITGCSYKSEIVD